MRTTFDALGSLATGLANPPADEQEDSPAEPRRRRYRSIFISDLHLGTPGCQAGPLLDFLRSHPSDHLYLVGDITDGGHLLKRWYWPQAHNDAIQKLLPSTGSARSSFVSVRPSHRRAAGSEGVHQKGG